MSQLHPMSCPYPEGCNWGIGMDAKQATQERGCEINPDRATEEALMEKSQTIDYPSDPLGEAPAGHPGSWKECEHPSLTEGTVNGDYIIVCNRCGKELF